MTVVDLSAKASRQSLARLVGISPRAVGGLVERGILHDGNSLATWLQAYCARLREEAAGRMADDGLNLASERARLARAQRERIEDERSRVAGEYVARRVVLATWAHMVGSFRTRMLAIPNKLAPLVANTAAGECADLLEREVHEALAEVSGEGLPRED